MHFKSHLVEGEGLQCSTKKKDKIHKNLKSALDRREKVYQRNPVNILNIRGYAWSKHVMARYLLAINQVNNHTEALNYLHSAYDIREKGEARFHYRGLYEDILKNLAEIYRLATLSKDAENMTFSQNEVKEMAHRYLKHHHKRADEIKERVNDIFKDYGCPFEITGWNTNDLNWKGMA